MDNFIKEGWDRLNNNLDKVYVLLIALGLILLAFIGKLQIVAFILIGLGLLGIHPNYLDSFSINGVFELKFKEYKKKLNTEAEKLMVKLLVRSIALDCSGEAKNNLIAFFCDELNINKTLEITQTDNYSLEELKKEGFITYAELTEKGRAVNSTGDKKRFYQITLIKTMDI